MKPWPHPSDPPPEAKWFLGAVAMLVILGAAIAIYSAVAPVLG